VTSDCKGYTIHNDRDGAWFVYEGNAIKTSGLSSAMQVIDCLIEYDARHEGELVVPV
jgi:hypothetical protein